MPNKYFAVAGVATYVHHTGPTTLPDSVPDLRRGEVVLFLHGAGGNGNVYAGLLERLAAEHSPIAFDLPGHGRSGELDSLGSIERMAAFTRAFVERLGLRKPVLFGHSLGGAVAMRYALDHPDELRALVLCATGASFHVADAQIDRLRLVAEGKARREFNRQAYASSAPPEVLRQAFGEELKTDPRARLGDVIAASEWNAAAEIGRISVPTLVVHGEEDAPQLAKEADVLVSGIAGAKKVVIPRAATGLPLEQPDALAEAVRAFLAELEP
ncbi:MAG: alpha/beta hydrolase [Myxococcota bacterium]